MTGLKTNEEKDKWLDTSVNVLKELSRRHWTELRRYIQHDNFSLREYYSLNAEAYLRYYNSYISIALNDNSANLTSLLYVLEYCIRKGNQRAKMLLNNELARIEVSIIGNEFEHIKLEHDEEVEDYLVRLNSKTLMSYNMVCKEVGKRQIKNMVTYANHLVGLIRNYADEGDDITFEQDFHDDILDTLLTEERDISAVLRHDSIGSVNAITGTKYENIFMNYSITPLNRLESLSRRLCSMLNLSVVRGRVEACETIIDLIENCKDNYVMELNRTND